MCVESEALKVVEAISLELLYRSSYLIHYTKGMSFVAVLCVCSQIRLVTFSLICNMSFFHYMATHLTIINRAGLLWLFDIL